MVLLTPLGLATLPLAAQTEDLAALGNDAWLRRHEKQEAGRAQPQPIDTAIDAFTRALEVSPEDLGLRWQLLRALYFKGEYVLDDSDEKLALFERSRDLADGGRNLLHARHRSRNAEDLSPEEIAAEVGDDPDAAATYFWSAVHWGLWGRHRGALAAAKAGVASKIRRFAETVVLLDEVMEEAGGHRILGRLHAEAPKLPFVTGWVDRDLAISELERAMELAPEGLLTHLYLAEALLEFRPHRRAEALDLLRALSDRTPNPAYEVEETRIIEDARRLLNSLEQ